MAKNYLRKAFFIDHAVQGELLRKAATAWLLSLAFVGTLTILGWIFIAPGLEQLIRIREFLPSLLGIMIISLAASFAVLPVLLYDLIKLTNRFAGPVFRLQCSMKDLAEGKDVKPISFREGDYWLELAESFNGIAARLKSKHPTAEESEILEFDTLVRPVPVEEPLSI